MKYTYDPGVNFSGPKTYQWAAQSSYSSSQDSLMEANVRFYADKDLEAKGWTKAPEQAALIFSINDNYPYYYSYESRWVLTQLELRAVRREDGKAVWRGAAAGNIDTSATSSELKDAVNGIMSSFPPK